MPELFVLYLAVSYSSPHNLTLTPFCGNILRIMTVTGVYVRWLGGSAVERRCVRKLIELFNMVAAILKTINNIIQITNNIQKMLN